MLVGVKLKKSVNRKQYATKMSIGIFCYTYFVHLEALIRLLGSVRSNEETYRRMEICQFPTVYAADVVTISNVTHHVY